MQRKLNEAFLADYCHRFCEQVSDPFFLSKEVIDGKAILSLTPSKQVNFFILKTLFTSWQEEMKRLESPYFNFRDSEVRNAMVSFMNLLSQKIEIRKADFDPLLKEAVDQTVRILIDPAGFTIREFDKRGLEKVSEKTLKTFFKYVKVYKGEFEELASGVDGVSASEFGDLLVDHFSELDPEEELRNHLDILSQVAEIRVEDLFEAEEAVELEELDTFQPEFEDEPEEEALPAPDSAFENPETYKEAERFISNQEGDPSEASRELVYQEEEDREFEDEEEPSIETEEHPEAEFEEDLDVEEKQTEPVQFGEDPDTQELNDRFESKNVTVVTEKQTRISSVSEAISLANKQLFIKDLFDSDVEAFEAAIAQIEECASFDEAVEMIVHQHAKVRDWDMNSDEVKELLKVVFRRFR